MKSCTYLQRFLIVQLYRNFFLAVSGRFEWDLAMNEERILMPTAVVEFSFKRVNRNKKLYSNCSAFNMVDNETCEVVYYGFIVACRMHV